MRIFITGATGFIGTHLVERLRETSHELLCLTRATSRVEMLEKAGATLIRGDVTDKDSLLSGMKGCEWIVNLANLFEFWVPDRSAYERVNVDGTRNVMEAAIAACAHKVVHVSTAAVYGDAPWPVTESSEPGARCFSEYARTKRAGDLVAWELHETQRLPLVMVYPGGVVGSGDPKAAGRYVSNVARGRMPAQVLTKSMFPFVHVRDVAEGIVRALEKDGNVGERYLLVGENLTFGDLNRSISEICGRKLPVLSLPDSLTMFGAYLMTGLANLVRRPPILDLATDQVRLMRHGMQVDGSKAARELGFSYTPVRVALEDEVAHLSSGDTTRNPAS